MVEAVAPKPVTVTATTTQTSTASEKAAVKKEAAPAGSVPVDISPINPRLRFDAVSGVVITEFLDQAGSIQAQSPSSAVMAYLRAGLSEDGRGNEEKA